MKKLTFSLLSVRPLADGAMVFITKPTAGSPSPTGNYIIKASHFKRICIAALGVYNPLSFKHLVDSSNGAAKLSFDCIERKIGEAWENKVTGQSGTYTKDFVDYKNHEVSFGTLGQMKLMEFSLKSMFDNQLFEQPVTAPRASTKAEVVHTEAEESHEGDAAETKSATPNV